MAEKVSTKTLIKPKKICLVEPQALACMTRHLEKSYDEKGCATKLLLV